MTSVEDLMLFLEQHKDEFNQYDDCQGDVQMCTNDTPCSACCCLWTGILVVVNREPGVAKKTVQNVMYHSPQRWINVLELLNKGREVTPQS